MAEKLLEVKDLHVSFFTPAGEVKAVGGISYDLNYGEVMGVVGESGSCLLYTSLVDANELGRSVCSEQFPVSVKIHCEADGPLMIKADGELLSRLVRNLIENAVKYGKPDGNVWIRTGRMQGEFFLDVYKRQGQITKKRPGERR